MTLADAYASGFKPKLRVGSPHCPHYFSVHRKDASICAEAYRCYEGLLPDGRWKPCGPVDTRNTHDKALAYYDKRLHWWEIGQRRIGWSKVKVETPTGAEEQR